MLYYIHTALFFTTVVCPNVSLDYCLVSLFNSCYPFFVSFTPNLAHPASLIFSQHIPNQGIVLSTFDPYPPIMTKIAIKILCLSCIYSPPYPPKKQSTKPHFLYTHISYSSMEPSSKSFHFPFPPTPPPPCFFSFLCGSFWSCLRVILRRALPSSVFLVSGTLCLSALYVHK